MPCLLVIRLGTCSAPLALLLYFIQTMVENFAIPVNQIYAMNLILGMLKVEKDVHGFKPR